MNESQSGALNQQGQISPFEILYEKSAGAQIPLPAALGDIYGPLFFPDNQKPHVYANYVSSLDGVVTLGIKGKEGGGEISGFNQHDRLLMGILRASADAVIIAAGSLDAAPQSLWTADHIYPKLTSAFHQLRAALALTAQPLTVIVTGGGEINTNLHVFRSGEGGVLVVTTEQGRVTLQQHGVPDGLRIVNIQAKGWIRATDILGAIQNEIGGSRYLVEGGPHLLGQFVEDKCLNELFLTLAPQIAGRNGGFERLGLVAGKIFAPEHPVWGRMVSLRKAGEHLFTRYSFSYEDGLRG